MQQTHIYGHRHIYRYRDTDTCTHAGRYDFVSLSLSLATPMGGNGKDLQNFEALVDLQSSADFIYPVIADVVAGEIQVGEAAVDSEDIPES